MCTKRHHAAWTTSRQNDFSFGRYCASRSLVQVYFQLLDQELISYVASHSDFFLFFFLLLLLGRHCSKNAQGSVVSNHIGMKFGSNRKFAPTEGVGSLICCHLRWRLGRPSAAVASARCPLASQARDVTGSLYVLQFLIHSTFVYLFTTW